MMMSRVKYLTQDIDVFRTELYGSGMWAPKRTAVINLVKTQGI